MPVEPSPGKSTQPSELMSLIKGLGSQGHRGIARHPYQQESFTYTGDASDSSLGLPAATAALQCGPNTGGNVTDPRAEARNALMKLASGAPTSDRFDFPVRTSFRDSVSQVHTNHFSISVDTETTLYEYTILGAPADKSRSKTKELIQALIAKRSFLKKSNDSFATDNVSKIMSWKNLHETIEYPVMDRGEDGKPREWGRIPVGSGDRPAMLRFQFTREVKVVTLLQYANAEVKPKKVETSEIGPAINTLNILISRVVTSQAILLRANKFFVKSGHQRLGSGSLCTIRGYFYTTKPGMGQLLLNVNACTSAFFSPILVSGFLRDGLPFEMRTADTTP